MSKSFYPWCDYVETDAPDEEPSEEEFIESKRDEFMRQWNVYIREYDEGENEY